MKIGTDDPNMNFEHRGRRYRTNQGVAEMPDSVARSFLNSDIPGVEVYHGTNFIVGNGEAENVCPTCAFSAWAFSKVCPRCDTELLTAEGKNDESPDHG